jgi:hypothetical protein
MFMMKRQHLDCPASGVPFFSTLKAPDKTFCPFTWKMSSSSMTSRMPRS